jgi:hypothetical protein
MHVARGRAKAGKLTDSSVPLRKGPDWEPNFRSEAERTRYRASRLAGLATLRARFCERRLQRCCPLGSTQTGRAVASENGWFISEDEGAKRPALPSELPFAALSLARGAKAHIDAPSMGEVLISPSLVSFAHG